MSTAKTNEEWAEFFDSMSRAFTNEDFVNGCKIAADAIRQVGPFDPKLATEHLQMLVDEMTRENNGFKSWLEKLRATCGLPLTADPWDIAAEVNKRVAIPAPVDDAWRGETCGTCAWAKTYQAGPTARIYAALGEAMKTINIYCPKCGGRTKANANFDLSEWEAIGTSTEHDLSATCLECETTWGIAISFYERESEG